MSTRYEQVSERLPVGKRGELTMGERAIACVAGPKQQCWYQSQWGATETVLDDVFTATDPLDVVSSLCWTETEPVAIDGTGTQMNEIAYLIRPDGIDVFVALWFGLGLRDPPPSSVTGAFVPVSSLSAVRAVRRSHRRLKTHLLDSVDAEMTPGRARALSHRVAALVTAVAVQFHRTASI